MIHAMWPMSRGVGHSPMARGSAAEVSFEFELRVARLLLQSLFDVVQIHVELALPQVTDSITHRVQ